MMIYCEKLKTSFTTPNTCIARIKILKINDTSRANPMAWGNNGAGGHADRYAACLGCETGEKYYQEYLEMEMEKKKVGRPKKEKEEQPVEIECVPEKPTPVKKEVIIQKCRTCKRDLPLDENNFPRDASMASGFKSQCKECRAKYRPDRQAEKIILSFVDEPDVFTSIIARAKEGRRTPDQQVIWELEQYEKMKGVA